MPSHVVVNGLGLTYKGTLGLSTATIPDVCKTPSPGGPIPLPYPNIATQATLKGGTTTVKAKGKMIAVKGSQYGSSNGDEAGTAGGIKSSVNMKATDWITYSFDVKMDGNNACRHTDKKFHNNQNTVCLGGQFDAAKPPTGLTPREFQLWKPCVEKHQEYDAIKEENDELVGDTYTQQKGETYKETKERIFSNQASREEIIDFLNLTEKRIELFQKMHKERQRYIDMGCDEIAWPGTTKTHAERRQRHEIEVGNTDQFVSNQFELKNQLKAMLR